MTQKDSQDDHPSGVAGEPAAPEAPSGEDKARRAEAGQPLPQGQAATDDLGAVIPSEHSAADAMGGAGAAEPSPTRDSPPHDLPWLTATDRDEVGRFRPGLAREPQLDVPSPVDGGAQDATGRDIMDRADANDDWSAGRAAQDSPSDDVVAEPGDEPAARGRTPIAAEVLPSDHAHDQAVDASGAPGAGPPNTDVAGQTFERKADLYERVFGDREDVPATGVPGAVPPPTEFEGLAAGDDGQVADHESLFDASVTHAAHVAAVGGTGAMHDIAPEVVDQQPQAASRPEAETWTEPQTGYQPESEARRRPEVQAASRPELEADIPHAGPAAKAAGAEHVSREPEVAPEPVSRNEDVSRAAFADREQPEGNPASDADTGHRDTFREPEPIVVRTAWENPPPLAETPAWVWRDVAPDTVERHQDPPLSEPEPPSVDRVREFSDEVPASHEELIEPPSPGPATDTPGAVEASAVADDRIDPIFARADARGAFARVHDDAAHSPNVAPEAETLRDPERAPAAPRTPPPELQSLSALSETPPAFEVRHDPTWRPERVRTGFRRVPSVNELDDGVARAPPQGWDRAKEIGRTGLRYAAYAVGGYFALVLVLILVYRFVNPPASSLMVVQALTGTDVEQQWVPLEEISPALVRAVIVSEDWAFCEHYGIDIKAIEQAIERSGNGIPAGASTISMQTTKNLFLWNARSYIRKAVELPLTLMIELIWPKHRILEIYLNVAEWGPGIFGAEAAAQYHFNKPAARLGEREAAQLAASLPNPILREAGDPGPRTARKAGVIQSRMRNAGDAAQCVLGRR